VIIYPSIFLHIHKNIDPTGKLSGIGDKLPDDSRMYNESALRWVSGGRDGTMVHHGSGSKRSINKIAHLIKQISVNGELKDKILIYNMLVEDSIIGLIDPVLDKIVQLDVYPQPYLLDWAKWLAFESPDRGPVKFGIALLGLIGDQDNIEKLMVLGKHDEFTLYVAVALSNTIEDFEDYLWQLAKQVNGWGRIHLVESLAKTNNPEIKHWMVREGYKNSVLYEYLAYTCATTGNLKDELAQNDPGADLLTSAGEIIEALIKGGPAENIDIYKDAAEVTELYLNHTLGKGKNLHQFLILDQIRSYLSDSENNWNDLSKNGWNDDLRAKLISDIDRELSDPIWRELIREKQNTQGYEEFWDVEKAAEILGIDTWDVHWQRLDDNPHESVRWFYIMKNSNNDRIDKIIERALNRLDLEKISTGAEDQFPFGDEFEAHRCLGIYPAGSGQISRKRGKTHSWQQ
jgi:hypothetical protein